MADELSAESSAAIEAAVRVLSTSGPDLITAPAYADPTLDAMSVLAAELKSPLLPSNPAVEHRGDPVRDHATASGWLGWQVRLTGTWVDRVALPTLLTRRGKPAALLPRAGKPVLVDGSSRTTRPLDRAAAADVDPDAWVFAEDAPATGGWIALVRWSLRRQGRDLVGIVSLAIVGGLTALLLPVATSAIFRWAIPNGNFTLAVAMLIGFAIVSVGAAILAMSRGRLIIRVRDRMDVVLAHGVLARLLRLRAPFFRTQGVGDTANRALSVAAARAQVSDTAIAAVVLSFFGLTSLGYLFTAGPVLGLVTTLIVFGVLAVSVSIQWRARRILSELLEGRSQTDATVLSLLSSAVSWRVAAAESRAFRLWARRQNVSTTVLRRRLTAVSGAAVVDVAGPTIVLAAFTALVVFVPNGDLTPGSPTAPGRSWPCTPPSSRLPSRCSRWPPICLPSPSTVRCCGDWGRSSPHRWKERRKEPIRDCCPAGSPSTVSRSATSTADLHCSATCRSMWHRANSSPAWVRREAGSPLCSDCCWDLKTRGPDSCPTTAMPWAVWTPRRFVVS